MPIVLASIALFVVVIGFVMILGAFLLPFPQFVVVVPTLLLILLIAVPTAARYDDQLGKNQIMQIYLRTFDAITLFIRNIVAKVNPN
jgi:hypothetical protein